MSGTTNTTTNTGNLGNNNGNSNSGNTNSQENFGNVYTIVDGGDQKQDQDQDQWQKQLEAQLQAQLQAQLALQAQAQFQESKNDNENDNNNKNESENENKNESYNESKNENENENKNFNESKNENENENENWNANKNENENKNVNVNVNENKVDVEVDIDLDLDGELLPTVFELDTKFEENTDGINFFQADNVHQANGGDGETAGGGGNAFNLDQINNMVDNDNISTATVSWSSSGANASGSESYSATGGTVPIPQGIDVNGSFVQYAELGDNSGAPPAGYGSLEEDGAGNLTSTNSADTIVNQSAYNQEIVQGANLQNNSVSNTVVGSGGSYIGDVEGLDAA